MRKVGLFALFFILLVSFVLRLYRIDSPIADWHSWRQADTSAVSRNFVKHRFDVLHPRYDDLSKIPSGKENPQGYRFVEFPLYNFAQAGLFKFIGIYSLEIWGRLVSIFSSLFSTVFLYLLVKKRLGERIALLSAAFFGLIPFNIYYGRTILPDPSMVMAILGGIYFFEQSLKKEFPISTREAHPFQFPIFFILSIVFTASAFLFKPFALFFTLPIVYLAYERWGFRFIKKWQLWLFAFLTLTPLIAWRVWMQQFPEGIPANDWLFNANNIRFKGAFFYWIFADRIGRLILGYWGVALFILGLVRSIDKKEGWFFFSFLASSLFYIFIIAGGNVQHDYYQILIIPTLAIFLAKGADFLLTSSKELTLKTVRLTLLVLCMLSMLGFGWYHVRDYFNINNYSIVEAGRKADEVLPSNAKVIAPYNGDTSFLYQTNRQGWPVVDASMLGMVEKGAEYIVIANPTKEDFEGFGKTYKTVSSGKAHLILDLQEFLK